MNSKKEQWIICGLFCGFLAGMLALYLFLPKEDFSQKEKRYLAEVPTLSWQAVSGGEFSAAVDDYMADHIPGRDFFVGLNAYFEYFTGRQGAKDILVAADGQLVEAPVSWNQQQIQGNMTKINGFAEAAKLPVDLMIVPSAGWGASLSGSRSRTAYQDDAHIQNIYALAQDAVTAVDVVTPLIQVGQQEPIYYSTDHHWNSLGAYTACRSYMEQLGRDYPDRDAFDIESIPGFYGSTYSRAGLWLTPGEDLELWHGHGEIAVLHDGLDMPHAGVFFRDRLEETDKYTVFLDGNHPLVRLSNPEQAGSGKLLVVRDSFSNCLGGFLGEAWEEVIMIDLRYYRKSVSELVQAEGIDRILICYSLGNFMTDTNLAWLR